MQFMDFICCHFVWREESISDDCWEMKDSLSRDLLLKIDNVDMLLADVGDKTRVTFDTFSLCVLCKDALLSLFGYPY